MKVWDGVSPKKIPVFHHSWFRISETVNSFPIDIPPKRSHVPYRIKHLAAPCYTPVASLLCSCFVTDEVSNLDQKPKADLLALYRLYSEGLAGKDDHITISLFLQGYLAESNPSFPNDRVRSLFVSVRYGRVVRPLKRTDSCNKMTTQSIKVMWSHTLLEIAEASR